MQELSAKLVLRDASPPAGFVIVQNHSPRDVRVWDMGNTWGDDALTFEVTAAGKSAVIRKKPQRYTRNVPATVVIPPEGEHEIPFDLGDGTWNLGDARALCEELDAQLRAIYDSGDTSEVKQQGVWKGVLRTA